MPPLTVPLPALLMGGTLTPEGGQCLLRIPCFSAASDQRIAAETYQDRYEMPEIGEGAAGEQRQAVDREDHHQIEVPPRHRDAVREDSYDARQRVTHPDVQGVDRRVRRRPALDRAQQRP